MASLLDVDDALARVLARVSPLAPEPVALTAAAGRILAAPAVARVDLPPFPSSAMDGFALRSADTPGTLPVVARIAAGRPATAALAAREAMGIATGGVVPEGADAVVPIEAVVEHDNMVDVPSAVVERVNIRPAGGDVRAGDPVTEAGLCVTPARVAALAAAGVVEVHCGSRPRVVVVVTGTELRSAGGTLAPGEIYESNGVMLAALFAACGAQVDVVGPIPDDEASHLAALERGLSADVLVTSGGVSVGPHDLVRSVERSLGVEEVFWGVAMRPGKPLAFGVRGTTLVFGLPGNPVSSLVGGLLFVCPALLALQGAAEPGPPYASGILTTAIDRNPVRDDFVRARITRSVRGVELTPVRGQESHMIVRSAIADAAVRVPKGEGTLVAGSHALYLPF